MRRLRSCITSTVSPSGKPRLAMIRTSSAEIGRLTGSAAAARASSGDICGRLPARARRRRSGRRGRSRRHLLVRAGVGMAGEQGAPRPRPRWPRRAPAAPPAATRRRRRAGGRRGVDGQARAVVASRRNAGRSSPSAGRRTCGSWPGPAGRPASRTAAARRTRPISGPRPPAGGAAPAPPRRRRHATRSATPGGPCAAPSCGAACAGPRASPAPSGQQHGHQPLAGDAGPVLAPVDDRRPAARPPPGRREQGGVDAELGADHAPHVDVALGPPGRRGCPPVEGVEHGHGEGQQRAEQVLLVDRVAPLAAPAGGHRLVAGVGDLGAGEDGVPHHRVQEPDARTVRWPCPPGSSVAGARGPGSMMSTSIWRGLGHPPAHVAAGQVEVRARTCTPLAPA